MIQRTLLRSAGPLYARTEPCAVCVCRCGATFRHDGPSTQQKRYGPRASPATKRKKRAQEVRVLTPEERRRKQGDDRLKSLYVWDRVKAANDLDQMTVAPEQAVDFLTEFAELAQHDRSSTTAGVATDFYRQLQDSHEVNEPNALLMALLLLQDTKSDENRSIGKRLLFTLSAAGYEDATILIVNHALLSSKTRPGTLRSSEIAHARGHLQRIAREKVDYRAMVLEGKVAYKLGDEDYAIKLWWDAIDAAVAASKPDAQSLAQNAALNGVGGLSSPWIELMKVHHARCVTRGLNERDLLEKAIQIGMEQDDPTSFYYAATFHTVRGPGGEILHNSLWLYYMTKAAASGIPTAAHELGKFYAQSGWKYITDEPPDKAKPTAFDSYPPAMQTSTASPSVWDRLLSLFAPAPPPPSPLHSIFHHAAWPPTPEDRWRLALRWLSIATNRLYAPAYLTFAQMALKKKLWSQAQAPQTALNLSPERYSHATQAEHDDARDAGFTFDYQPENASDPPNRLGSPQTAKTWLAEVFSAVHAHRLRQQHIRLQREAWQRGSSNYTRHGTKLIGDEADAFEDVRFKIKDAPASINRWYREPDVRETYEDKVEDLYAQAAQICEEQGWDIRDAQGGLAYQHGLKKS